MEHGCPMDHRRPYVQGGSPCPISASWKVQLTTPLGPCHTHEHLDWVASSWLPQHQLLQAFGSKSIHEILFRPSSWIIFHCSPRYICRKLNWKWSSWDSNPFGIQHCCLSLHLLHHRVGSLDTTLAKSKNHDFCAKYNLLATLHTSEKNIAALSIFINITHLWTFQDHTILGSNKIRELRYKYFYVQTIKRAGFTENM